MVSTKKIRMRWMRKMIGSYRVISCLDQNMITSQIGRNWKGNSRKMPRSALNDFSDRMTSL
ncbi:hypothetical protein H5410_045674 [Solanum commersonii]|uniref:Uncharacterized protein n=1 Tax=Solanum commersonii TaxID=4109 RepID=A0A9J5XEC4_SOLCO|nr:hypothetical protein H5410_045674 [Solanum commersonii]